MSVLKFNNPVQFKDFANMEAQLGFAERVTPSHAAVFFQDLMKEPMLIFSVIDKNNAEADIRRLVAEGLAENIKQHDFYDYWIKDMVQNTILFSEMLHQDKVTFWLGSQRGCRRYHVDKVPMRMLVTYAGKGTEWLPNEAVDREAYEKGAKNDEIIRSPQARRYMDTWDVAVFKGGGGIREFYTARPMMH